MEEEAKKTQGTYADGDREPVRWYQGRSGKVSAKRVAGLILILSGVVISVLCVLFNYEAAESILWPLLSAGTFLIGAGVLERFGNGGNK